MLSGMGHFTPVKCIASFLVFIFKPLIDSTDECEGGERGGVTCSKGPQAGVEPGPLRQQPCIGAVNDSRKILSYATPLERLTGIKRGWLVTNSV